MGDETDERKWDLEELHRLCRLRSTLESFAVVELRRAATRAAVFARLTQHLERLQYYAIRGDYSSFHPADRELHRELVRSSGLPCLEKAWELVVLELDAWIHHVQEKYWPSLMSLYREHVFLLEAWQSPEDWVAAESTHQHLEAGWYRLAATQSHFIPSIDPVDRATAFISTHYASSLDMGWVASQVSFVSSSHLNRLFREKLGLSPYVFLKQVRMERAAELLLSSPDKVAAIAARVGYKNVSHFGRDFHKHFGVTPLTYRQDKRT